MENMHKLLKKQLLKSFKNLDMMEELQPELKKFLGCVNEAYHGFDKDRILIERSLEISSKEYIDNLSKINKLQAQLIHQEKMAGIGQLSAGIAHEINNPLGFIMSNTETMKKYVEKLREFYVLINTVLKLDNNNSLEEFISGNQKINEYIKKNKMLYICEDIDDIVKECEEGLNRIEKIVKSLLSFARRNLAEGFDKYDINKGIMDTLTIANNEIKYYAEVKKELSDIPFIIAIGDEVNQVLLNIIVNAAHSIKEKGKTGLISIQTYHKDDFVHCGICDNGVGIPKANLKRIFEPFFTTKPVGVGTGLGLSIAHDIIVDKHSGKIDINSEVGVGTEFIISLPVNQK